MARDDRPQLFPFPIPEPPVTRRVPHSTPFPPPPLPPADETVHILARRVAGVPLPLFFAIGAVVGIVLAMTVVSIVRRVSPRRATQAKVVSIQTAPLVEHAHALFVWRPETAVERAPSAAPTLELDEAASAVMPPLVTQTMAPMRTAMATNGPRAIPRAKAPAPVNAAPASRVLQPSHAVDTASFGTYSRVLSTP